MARTDKCEEVCPDSRVNTLMNVVDFMKGLEKAVRECRQNVEKEVRQIHAQRILREEVKDKDAKK